MSGERISKEQKFALKGTVLNDGKNNYTFLGKPTNPEVAELKPIKSYQEYWHSWETFHPLTQK